MNHQKNNKSDVTDVIRKLWTFDPANPQIDVTDVPAWNWWFGFVACADIPEGMIILIQRSNVANPGCHKQRPYGDGWDEDGTPEGWWLGDGADGIESLTVMMASPLAATSHLDVNSMVVSTRDLPSKLLRILGSQLAIEMSQLYRYTIS